MRVVEPLTEDEAALRPGHGASRAGRDWIVLNKPPGLATQGGTKTVQHLDRLLDGLADDARRQQRPKLVHRLDKDTSGVLLVARSARAAGHFAKAFAGRTARKVYWALVVGVPSVDDGVIDAPLAKQPGTRRREDACRREGRASRQDPLPADRPRRQSRRLGRAAADDRAHAPASRAHGGDRPPDRRRCQIWRRRGVPDRRDQPQDAPPRAAAEDRRARRQGDRLYRRAAAAFRRDAGDAGVRARWPATCCRSTIPIRPRRPRPRPSASAAAKSARKARKGERRRGRGAPTRVRPKKADAPARPRRRARQRASVREGRRRAPEGWTAKPTAHKRPPAERK